MNNIALKYVFFMDRVQKKNFPTYRASFKILGR